MNQPATISRLLLFPEVDREEPTQGALRARRYRLARLQPVRPRDRRERFEYLKQSHD